MFNMLTDYSGKEKEQTFRLSRRPRCFPGNVNPWWEFLPAVLTSSNYPAGMLLATKGATNAHRFQHRADNHRRDPRVRGFGQHRGGRPHVDRLHPHGWRGAGVNY